jgi:tetratricopeptide (TPR) repeat protein
MMNSSPTPGDAVRNLGYHEKRAFGVTPEERMRGLDPEGQEALKSAAAGLAQGQLALAQQALDIVFAQAPQHAEALRMQGVIHHASGRRNEAAKALGDALARQPNDPLILNHLGAMLHESGELQRGLAMLRQAVELAPDMGAAWINLGRALQMESRWEEAYGALGRALQLQPDHLVSRIGYADSLKAMGRTADAAAEYRNAIRTRPDFSRAWFGLADLKTVALTDEEVATLERLYADARLPEADRTMIGFALGNVLEERERYADAFKILSAANAAKRRQIRWDAKEFIALVASYMDTFSAMPAAAPDPTLGSEIIFVVSLPRAGSTLTEQILAAHPEVEGGGELNDLFATIQEESRRRNESFPHWVAKATPDDWQRMGRRYLDRTAHLRHAHARMTDKALTNWPFIGAAAAMLPGARFVNCRRDPLETCWSCFKQLFGSTPHAFSYDLEELGTYWREYDRLMMFWHARYPGRIYDHIHEDLLAAPEAEVRRLLAFCNLPFDRACLQFHRDARTVQTASAAQVRQPLRADTARARKYADLLAPLHRSLDLP